GYVHSSISNSVRHWRDRNRAVISDSWISNDRQLANRFVEYGRFENDRLLYNRQHPDQPMQQEDFIRRNSPRYPTVNRSSKEVSTRKSPRQTTRLPDKRSDDKKPSVTDNPRYPKPSDAKARGTISTRPVPPRTVPKVDKAREYHRDQWEKNKSRSKTYDKTRAPRVSPRKPTKVKPPVKSKPKSSPRKTKTKTDQ
ncbi:MAG: hypothetical protein AAFO94_15070, partial [Bacteroidota bacterium]